ncbi:MAG: hypothetical protein AAFP77_29215 [Bacteroidota bacterium]
MSRFTLLITLFLCLVFFSMEGLQAQSLANIDASLQWGDRQKAPNNSQFVRIIQAGSWGAYILRFRPQQALSSERYWIEHYNAQMDMTGRFEFELPGEGKVDLEDIINLRNKLYLVTSRPDAQKENSQLWLRPFSPRGEVIEAERLMASLPFDDKFRRRQYDLEFSRDSSFLLMYNQLPPEEGGPERFTLRVFDDNFQMIWTRQVELPHPDRGFSVRSYQVDQGGNVFLLGRKEARKDSDEVPQYFIYAYTRDGQQETAYQLDIEGVQLNRLLLRVAGNGDMVCGGLYGVPGQRSNLGVCHIRINPLTQEAFKVDLLPFTDAFLTNSTTENENALVSATRSYKLRELVLRSDGGIVLTGEQSYRSEAPFVSQGMGVVPSTLFHYNDIMVANVAPDGTYTWLRRIPKEQVTSNDGGRFSSFAQATVQDRFFFLYNDHPDEYRPERNRSRSLEAQNTVISISEITRAGQVAKEPLYINSDAGVKACPRRCRQISARRMLVYGEDGRTYRLGILTF